MTFISVLFLVLELLILAVGILMGYRRGIGRSMVRLAYLAVIGIASFILGRLIAFRLSDSMIRRICDLLPTDAQALLATAPELEALVASLLGALIAPIVFALLFGILQLLTLIFFKTLSGKLVSSVYKKQEAPSWSKWAGAGVGLVSAVAIAAVLLSPLFTAMYMVEKTPDETLTIFAEALFEEDEQNAVVASVPGGAMKAPVMTLRPELDTAFDMTHLIPWETILLRALTDYEIPAEGTDAPAHRESASDSLPALIEAAGDALYAYNKTATKGGSSIDAFTNAAAAIIPHLEQSPTIKQAATDALSAMGQTLQNGGSIMGMELPQTENALLKNMIDNLVNTLAETTTDTVEDNMKTLFGELDDSLKPESKRKQPEQNQETPAVTDPIEVETEAETEAATVPVPEETKPVESKPAESKPADSKPAESKPAESKPVESAPAESKPAQTETTTPPVTETEPKGTETTESKPAEQPSKPADTTTGNTANNGLLSALSKLDKEDPLGSLKNEETAGIIKDAFGGIADNPAMAGLMNEIRSYAMSLIQQKGIDIMDEKYQPMYETVCYELGSVLSDCLSSGITSTKEVASILEARLMAEFENYKFPVESYQVGLVAQCAASEFLSDKYVDGTTVTVTVKDILSFFGIAEADMPEWAL